MNYFIALLIGTISYFLAGLGLGGGAVLLPALTDILSVSPAQARYISLAAYLPAATGACISGMKNKTLEPEKIFPFLPFGIAGAIAGSVISQKISDGIFKKIYGLFLILFGIYMLIKSIKNNNKTHKE